MSKQYQYSLGDGSWCDLRMDSGVEYHEVSSAGVLLYRVKGSIDWYPWQPNRWRVKPEATLPGYDRTQCGVWYISGDWIKSWLCYDPETCDFVEVFGDGSHRRFANLESLQGSRTPRDQVVKVRRLGCTE